MNEKSETAATPKSTREGQRIAKVMARAGLCSRRDAEAWILEGRVSVNGKILESPAFNVTAGDDVRVDGQRLKEAERTRLFLFHKPRGLVTTARDPEGRATIFDALPEDLPRVVAVGRLDINTEGLLLLTNDGGLARVLELPATGWLRRYRVRAHGAIEQAQLDALREGVTIEGIQYAGIEARLEREQGSNVWLMMGLREGKNREIKRVLEHLGLSVNRLIRVSFGPFELGDLAEGEVEEIRTRVLRDQLGVKLAREAGVNFDGEIVDSHAAPPPASPAKRAERSERGERGDRPRQAGRERPDREPFVPEPSTIARKRKHVTALRAEAEAGASGPRRRIERGATSDRRGREIKVERIKTAGARSRGDDSQDAARPSRRGPPREGAERSVRSPGAEGHSFEKRATAGEGRQRRDNDRPFSKRPPSGEGRSLPREGRTFEKRTASGEGRPSRDGDRPFSKRPPSGEGRFPPREGRTFEKRTTSGEGRPSRDGDRPFSKRPPSGEGRFPPREGRTFEKRTASGEGRPSRDGDKPFSKRPPSGEGRFPPREGRTFEKRTASGEGRPSRAGDKPFSKRPPSGEGRFPPREGRTFEKRAAPGEGRPPREGGKPFGKRPPSGEGRSPPREGRTFEKRSSGEGRPPRTGGKPPGKRFGGEGGGRPQGGSGGKRPPRRS